MESSANEKLHAFRPRHSFFVGIDSDGSVFDTMEIKQRECFIPNIIKYWKLQAVSKYVHAAAEFVNLYSKSRGVNRFPGLTKTIELLRDWPEAMRSGAEFPISQVSRPGSIPALHWAILRWKWRFRKPGIRF